jgi:hypothetical protein
MNQSWTTRSYRYALRPFPVQVEAIGQAASGAKRYWNNRLPNRRQPAAGVVRLFGAVAGQDVRKGAHRPGRVVEVPGSRVTSGLGEAFRPSRHGGRPGVGPPG